MAFNDLATASIAAGVAYASGVARDKAIGSFRAVVAPMADLIDARVAEMIGEFAKEFDRLDRAAHEARRAEAVTMAEQLSKFAGGDRSRIKIYSADARRADSCVTSVEADGESVLIMID